MKRLYKVLAAMFALALVLAAPDMAITSHAIGFVGDWEGDANDGQHYDGNPWNSHDPGAGGSTDNGSSSAPSYNAPSYDSGSSDDSGHHDSGSSDNGNSYDNGSYTDSGSSDNGNGNGGASSAPAKNPNDMTVSAGGAQPFRIVMNSAHTAYDVYHCGIKQGTVTVTDTDGNPVAYKAVKVEQGEDNLWYMNITFAEGVDTGKLTVTLGNTCASYVAKELGISGLKVNGVLVLSTVAK